MNNTSKCYMEQKVCPMNRLRLEKYAYMALLVCATGMLVWQMI